MARVEIDEGEFPHGSPAEQIEMAASWLFPHRAPVEVRIFNGDEKISGIFSDRRALYEAAESVGSVYWVLNEIATDVPASNELRAAGQGGCVKDKNIARRHNILLDIDPTRPKDTTATDAEHQLAVAKAAEVKAFLSSQGWPAPLEMSSGSGSYLIYGCDLPGESRLPERLLKVLAAKFNDDGAKIDTSVFNAARIARVPGTRNQKGEPTEQRPIRDAFLIAAPVRMVVTEAQIEALTGKVEDEAFDRLASSVNVEGEVEKIRAFLVTHNIKNCEEQCGGEFKFHLTDGCLRGHPFKDGRPAIVVSPSRGVFYKCFESGCAHRLKDFYSKYEPNVVIDLTNSSRKEIAERTAEALKKADVYQRGGILCRIRQGNPLPPGVLRKADSAIIVPMPYSAIAEEIAEHVEFTKFDARKDKVVRTVHPGWLVENIADRGVYPVPVIEGVSSVPLFLPDGSILTKPGYDSVSGIYFAPDIHYGEMMSVPDALAAIDDVLCDFPFAKLVHKAATVAAVLTLLARRAIPGHVPFFLLEGNRPGVGKGLLADCIGLIGNGSPFARMTAPESEDEWRKRLTSVFMSGEPAILLDNLSGKLKSSVLDAALTSDVWTDRLLGRNETVRVPATVVFLGTGNKLTLHPDTVRRVCHVRLASTLERPEDRSDCKHKSLLLHVQANRGKLTAAALSLLHHYHQAGRPDQGLKPWGGFEGWTLIRNVLVWTGLPDPAETLVELRTANNDEATLHRSLMDGWLEAGGCLTAREAVEAAYDGNKHPILRAAIEEIEGRNKVQALGQKLRQYMGCHLDGRHFERSEGRITKWSVQT